MVEVKLLVLVPTAVTPQGHTLCPVRHTCRFCLWDTPARTLVLPGGDNLVAPSRYPRTVVRCDPAASEKAACVLTRRLSFSCEITYLPPWRANLHTRPGRIPRRIPAATPPPLASAMLLSTGLRPITTSCWRNSRPAWP